MDPVKQNIIGFEPNKKSSETLIAYLQGRLDELVDLSIKIAIRNGYAPYTTTIRAAWVQALTSVTDSLDLYFKETKTAPLGAQAEVKYHDDPRFFQMRKIARIHRSLGITMPMYLGLFKHFRNLYFEQSERVPGGLSDRLRAQIRDFFDEVELAISTDWQATNSRERIRELQESARASALEKDRYFAIFESLRSPAFLLSKSFELINSNQAASELYFEHSEAGEFVYIESDIRTIALQEGVAQILSAVENDQPSAWLDTRQGRRYFDIRLRALHDSVQNIPLGYVVLLNDITAHREETEKAQKSEQGMLRFMSTMSHEIRTPLHSVLGASELLRRAGPQEAPKYLAFLEDASQTLLQTLNNVLDYSKLESGGPTPAPSSVHLPTKIMEFKRNAALGPHRDKAELRFHLQETMPEWIEIDWTLTQQILSNLVTNSLRADKGKSGVDISILFKLDRKNRIRFEVRDYGPGLPEADAEALFRPIEKTAARFTQAGGTGLGLAIVHNIVEAMQGEIGYQNYKDGALVWFELPCQADQQSHVEHSPNPTFESVLSIQGSDCLVVDDDPVGQLVTAGLLEQLNFNVSVAGTIKEALEKTAERRFDIYIVDYILPDGIGPDFVKALQKAPQSEPSDKAVFIALSANIEALRDDNRTAECFDFILAKPADLSMLRSEVRAENHGAQNGLASERLAGLSPSTIKSMLQAFEASWADFRNHAEAFDQQNENAKLRLLIHRLAGSTSILGLSDLERKLRAALEYWPDRQNSAEFGAVLASLNVDIETLSDWRELNELVVN